MNEVKVISVERTNKGRGIRLTFRQGTQTETVDVRKTGGEKYPRLAVGCDHHDGRVWAIPTRQTTAPRVHRWQSVLHLIDIDSFGAAQAAPAQNPADGVIDLSPAANASAYLAKAFGW